MIDLSPANLFSVLEKEDALVVFFQRDALWKQQKRVIPKKAPIYAVEIKTVGDADAVQVCKLPQFRLYKDGSEIETHVGIASAEIVLSLLNKL